MVAWWPATAIVLAFLAGAVGGVLWLNGQHGNDVELGEHFAGTVSQVASDGTGICLTEDGNGQQRCSTPMMQSGSSVPQVGEHVTVTVARVRINEDAQSEVFIVVVPPPPANEDLDDAL
jgi:hypothetical protein